MFAVLHAASCNLFSLPLSSINQGADTCCSCEQASVKPEEGDNTHADGGWGNGLDSWGDEVTSEGDQQAASNGGALDFSDLGAALDDLAPVSHDRSGEHVSNLWQLLHVTHMH